MVRISVKHLNTILERLNEEYEKMNKIREVVENEILWCKFSEGIEGDLCGVDGSMAKIRLCGGVMYGISANAIGKNVNRKMFEMNILSTSKNNVQDRVRRLMLTLEYRLAAMVGKNVDLILMDGTLYGALILPPLLTGDVNPLNTHLELAEDLGQRFIRSLDEFWKEVLENMDGNVYENTLLSQKIFQKSKSDYDEYVEDIRHTLMYNRIFDSNNRDIVNWEVFFEYIELLHSLDKLLEWDCVFIAKTFYEAIISKSLKEKGLIKNIILDAPLLNMVYPQKGYTLLPKDYNTSSRMHVNKIYETFKSEFKSLKTVRENPFEGIIKTYVRFADNAPLLMLEFPRTNKKSIKEVITLLTSYSKHGYPRYLKDAHHKAKISQEEFRKYILFLIQWILEKNEEFETLLKNGREVLGD